MRSFRLVTAAAVTLALASASAGGTAAAVTGTPDATASSVKPAKVKALKKCKRLNKVSKRRACIKRVNRRFAKPTKPNKPVVPAPEPVIIDVRDDYFSPNVVTIKKGQSIKWVWDDLNHDPHNIDLSSAPAGVKHSDFQTSTAPAVEYEFTRTFLVPGTYLFACSLHHLMTLTIEVTN